MLGPLSSFHGHDEGLNVHFPPPHEPIRHLGILLSHDKQLAATLMFEKRRKAVFAAIRRWGRFALSYLGRLHVAKQVLASSVYFHASFVQPPAHLLDHIVGAVNHYVTAGKLAEGPVPPLRHVPCAAVESLPRRDGGLARADIPAQVTALQAKVAAMLVHPRRHSWKVFMRSAWQRAFPGEGEGVLVSRRLPARRGSLSARHLGYWRAFHALRPHRVVQPGQLSTAHVRAERLLHNGQVAPAATGKWSRLPASLGGVACVGDLAGALASEDSSRASAALQVYDSLPSVWQEHAQAGPQRAPLWEVSLCGQWVRSGRHALLPPFKVMADGRLADAGGEEPPAQVGWEPAMVSLAPCFKGVAATAAIPLPGHLARVHLPGQSAQQQPYLLGRCSVAPVDPNVWGVGSRVPVSHFVVREARERLLHLAAARVRPGYVIGQGARPRLWAQPGEEGSTGMAAWEQRLAAAFAAKTALLVSGSAAQAAGPSRRRPREEDLLPLYDAVWMHPSAPRLHPLERAAAAAQPPASGPAADSRQSDCVDEARPAAERMPWQPAYKALWDARLPRPLRYFGWQLLHGALPCGAARAPFAPPLAGEGGLLQQCLCSAAGCACSEVAALAPQPALETYTHMFWSCPMVAPAVAWLWDLWRRISGSAPPLEPAMLIVGDHTQWQPVQPALASLWQHLRLTFLSAVWAQRCRRQLSGTAFAAEAVVAATAAALQRDMEADWARVSCDIRDNAGVSPNWFAGRDPSMSPMEFQQRWCHGSVLARVEGQAAANQGDGVLVVCIPRDLPAAVGAES